MCILMPAHCGCSKPPPFRQQRPAIRGENSRKQSATKSSTCAKEKKRQGTDLHYDLKPQQVCHSFQTYCRNQAGVDRKPHSIKQVARRNENRPVHRQYSLVRRWHRQAGTLCSEYLPLPYLSAFCIAVCIVDPFTHTHCMPWYFFYDAVERTAPSVVAQSAESAATLVAPDRIMQPCI